jgi:membrane-associated phospholipid phosphatase
VSHQKTRIPYVTYSRRLRAVLAIYTFSVVGGRLYTGMHSIGQSTSRLSSTPSLTCIADVVAGSLLGVFCWGFWLAIADHAESWVESGSWAGEH